MGNRVTKRLFVLMVVGIIISLSVSASYREARNVKSAEVLVPYATYNIIGTLCALLGITVVAESSTQWQTTMDTEVHDSMKESYEDFRGSLIQENPEVVDLGIPEWDVFMESCKTGVINLSDNVWNALKTWGNDVYKTAHNTSVGGDFVFNEGTIGSGTYSQKCSVDGVKYNSSVVDIMNVNNVVNACGLKVSSSLIYFGALYKDQSISYSGGSDAITVRLYEDGKEVSKSKGYNTYFLLNNTRYYYTYGMLNNADYLSGLLHSVPVFDSWASFENYIITGKLTGDCTLPNVGDTDISDYTTATGINDIWDRDYSLDNYDVVTDGAVVDNGVIVGDRVAEVVPDDIWELLITGDITWPEIMEKAGVIAIDKADDTVPDDDDDPTNDKKVEDVLPNVTDKGKYVPKGLEKLFPFCIPFDLIYAFQVLTENSDAPVFEIPFKVEMFNIDYAFIVDMGEFDSLVKIFRVMETLSFIVSLILITRAIIKG